MKENEAPNKLYYAPYGDIREDYPITDNDIEYIRKDAFIEKALDYIENNIYDYYDGDLEYGICGGFVKTEEFIENFRKYMEGE